MLAGLAVWPPPGQASPPTAAMPSPVVAGPAEAAASLGVWLTTVDSGVLYEPAEATKALIFLQEQGFRRAALPLYTAGTVLWSPDPTRNRLGIPLDPRLAPGATAALLSAPGRAGQERVGWLEFGLMAPAAAPWLAGLGRLAGRAGHGAAGAAAPGDGNRLPGGPAVGVAQSAGVFAQQLSGRLERLGTAGAGG